MSELQAMLAFHFSIGDSVLIPFVLGGISTLLAEGFLKWLYKMITETNYDHQPKNVDEAVGLFSDTYQTLGSGISCVGKGKDFCIHAVVVSHDVAAKLPDSFRGYRVVVDIQAHESKCLL